MSFGLSNEVLRAAETRQALAESERRYATLAEASPVGLFRTDTKGLCRYVSERWMDIAGLTFEQARDTGWIAALHPDDSTRVQTEWEHAVQSDRPFESEYRFQRPDGRVTWVFGQAVAEVDTESNFVGYVGTITDITDRKQEEETLVEIAKGVTRSTGDSFYRELVHHIGRVLDADYTILAELISEAPGRVRTLAVCADGRLVEDFE
jgi:PAS domain S-box-containing protein